MPVNQVVQQCGPSRVENSVKHPIAVSSTNAMQLTALVTQVFLTNIDTLIGADHQSTYMSISA